jgi:hypothetical protein
MNTMKAKYQMIFLMDTEDKLWNIPISLHHKVPEKFGIEGIYLSILNTNYKKSKAKIALNGKKSEFISSKVRKTQGCMLSPILFSILLEILYRATSLNQ